MGERNQRCLISSNTDATTMLAWGPLLKVCHHNRTVCKANVKCEFILNYFLYVSFNWYLGSSYLQKFVF